MKKELKEQFLRYARSNDDESFFPKGGDSVFNEENAWNFISQAIQVTREETINSLYKELVSMADETDGVLQMSKIALKFTDILEAQKKGIRR